RSLAIRDRAAPHAVERPEEVHGRRPRRREPLDCGFQVPQKRIERVRATGARGESDAERRGHTDRRRAAHDEGADRRGDVFPGCALVLDFFSRESRLVEEDQAIPLPADGRDHAPSVSRRRAAVTPATLTSLSRLRPPPTTRTAERGTPAARAIRSTTASFARSSSGGAVTRSRNVSSRQPTTSSRDARGCTRTRMIALSERVNES